MHAGRQVLYLPSISAWGCVFTCETLLFQGGCRTATFLFHGFCSWLPRLCLMRLSQRLTVPQESDKGLGRQPLRPHRRIEPLRLQILATQAGDCVLELLAALAKACRNKHTQR